MLVSVRRGMSILPRELVSIKILQIPFNLPLYIEQGDGIVHFSSFFYMKLGEGNMEDIVRWQKRTVRVPVILALGRLSQTYHMTRGKRIRNTFCLHQFVNQVRCLVGLLFFNRGSINVFMKGILAAFTYASLTGVSY